MCHCEQWRSSDVVDHDIVLYYACMQLPLLHQSCNCHLFIVHLAPKNFKLSCVQLLISSGSPLNVLHFSIVSSLTMILYTVCYSSHHWASLSEPHTRELDAEISVRMYACLLACLHPSDFARELEVECSRGHVRITADSKSRSRRFDTGKWHAFFSSKIFFLQCTRMRISCQCKVQHIVYEAGYGDAVLQRLSNIRGR